MKSVDAYTNAISFLPDRIFNCLCSVNDELKTKIYEIRIRAEKAMSLITPDGIVYLKENGRPTYIYDENMFTVTNREVTECFNRLCRYSVYTYKNNISQGFITLNGGHRVGICGTAVYEDGKVSTIRDVSSLNIRIAKEFYGSADEILKRVFKNKLCNLIIAGPPTSGKTTMLRDIVRQVSYGFSGDFYKVCIVDERGEIASSFDGIPSNDVGPNTDVLSLFPKAEGIISAVRTLSPDLIVCDEIGAVDECEAICNGLNCGVNFIVSIHASSFEELEKKPQFRLLLSYGFFQKAVILKSGKVPCIIKEIIELGDENDKNSSPCIIDDNIRFNRTIC